MFLSVEEADRHCTAGASIWEKYSTDDGVDPDIVLVGIGFELTVEILACAKLLQDEFGSDLRVRVVNIVDLMVLDADHPHALSPAAFNSLFPPETPIVMNYHGFVAKPCPPCPRETNSHGAIAVTRLSLHRSCSAARMHLAVRDSTFRATVNKEPLRQVFAPFVID